MTSSDRLSEIRKRREAFDALNGPAASGHSISGSGAPGVGSDVTFMFEDDSAWDLSRAIAAAPADIDWLLAEVERLHSWDGLMALLDEHWPDDIFPTLPDREDRDPGARIVSLLRWVARLRSKLAEVREYVSPVADMYRDQISTHSVSCYERHVGCLAFGVLAILDGEETDRG